MRMVNTACDLLDLWFIWVAPVILAVFPTSNQLKASSALDTGCSVAPTTTTNAGGVKFGSTPGSSNTFLSQSALIRTTKN